MRIIEGLVFRRSFRNEADFKRAVIKTWQQDFLYRVIEIENEEKAPGMPDVLLISRKLPAILTEFKVADQNGDIKFQRTQPLFYKQHEDLLIGILAWDRCRAVLIEPSEIIDCHSLSFRIPNVINQIEDAHSLHRWYKLHI
jgi:hypothetical protein